MGSRYSYQIALENIRHGLVQYAAAVGPGLAADYVLGPAWLDAAKAFIVLLGGERGNMNAGGSDRLIRQVAVNAGFTEDLERK